MRNSLAKLRSNVFVAIASIFLMFANDVDANQSESNSRGSIETVSQYDCDGLLSTLMLAQLERFKQLTSEWVPMELPFCDRAGEGSSCQNLRSYL